MNTKKLLILAALVFGLILIVPLQGCKQEAPPENKPLTQKELEESLDEPGQFTKDAMKSWDAGKAKRDADMKAYLEEKQRKDEEAKREAEEFNKKYNLQAD